MRTLLILAVVLATCLPSCSSTSSMLEDAAIPRDKPERILAAANAAFATPDLDSDGQVNGLAEWEAFVRALAAELQR